MGNSVAILLQIHTDISVPKMIKIKRGLTKLLRNKTGAIFIARGVVSVYTTRFARTISKLRRKPHINRWIHEATDDRLVYSVRYKWCLSNSTYMTLTADISYENYRVVDCTDNRQPPLWNIRGQYPKCFPLTATKIITKKIKKWHRKLAIRLNWNRERKLNMSWNQKCNGEIMCLLVSPLTSDICSGSFGVLAKLKNDICINVGL